MGTAWIWLGVAIMIVSQAATFAKIEPFWSWNTPICWTGFIIFADAVVYRARGDSWIRSNPGEFAMLALASIPLWLVFEFFNLYLDNWYYDGLPENWWLRMFGYAWAFATIWPAIFQGAELTAVIRESRGSGGSRGSRKAVSSLPYLPDLPDLRALLCVAAGALMLALPFVVSPPIARYMAAPVWLGFIFLLEPINARLGVERLTRERIINLAWSGLLCGILWEFWNFWSRAKWHYTVPIMEHLKIFEMPVPGYLGFPAFAWECFTMFVFVRALVWRVYPGSDGNPADRLRQGSGTREAGPRAMRAIAL
jgi:hypothetical protein